MARVYFNCMKELVLATANRKKLAEMARILDGLGVRLLSVADFPSMPDVVEDAGSFEGNALKKAREVMRHTGLASLADDSGLEVDALGLAPGVYSARYAGEGATDADNVDKLLLELRDTPAQERTARFRCVIALVTPDGAERTFEGKVEGTIGSARHGDNGFGYDPLFFPEGHGRTFAQMAAEEKDSMSHRGRALAAFRKHLRAG